MVEIMKNGRVRVEDAQLMRFGNFSNFSGKPGKYNEEGKRNFAIELSPEDADMLKAEGWHVNFLVPRNPDESGKYFIRIKVNFGFISPKIRFVNSNGGFVEIGEDEVGQLDYCDIANADLILNLSRKGAAYLHSMWVTLEEDPFAAKYNYYGC